MKKLCDVLVRLLYFIGMLSVALFFLCTVIQVCSRLFGFQASFTEELANALLAWCCFIGGAALIYSDEHFCFTAMKEKLKGKYLFVDNVMCKLIVLAFNLVVAWYGIVLVRQFWSWSLTTMPISRGWIWLCVPIFGISGAIFSVNGLIEYVKNPYETKNQNAVDKAMEEAKEANK